MLQWSIFSRLVMFEQSLFGFPWVITGVILPFALPTHSLEFSWNLGFIIAIIIAFLAARTAGMAFNRIIDKRIDSANPRTRDRIVPQGLVREEQVWKIAIFSCLLFLLACFTINITCLMLAPLAILLLWLYPYTKRFTAVCHFILGSIHFLLPLFAWGAITNSLSWPPFLLGSAILFSIAGNDILYALQDEKFDRLNNLHSIPVLFERKNSIYIARGLHCFTIILFLILGINLHLNAIYYVGLGMVSIWYIYYHCMITPKMINKVNHVLFYCNTSVSLTYMLFTTGSILWHISL